MISSKKTTDFDVDDVIEKLLSVQNSKPGKQAKLLESEIQNLITKAQEIFMTEPSLLKLEAPLKICGDLHGRYDGLLRLLDLGGFPPETNYLFLGNYVDRGWNSIDTTCLLLAYKIRYPKNFFLLRGNHECSTINRMYGFYDECKKRYNVKLWEMFGNCFDWLPIAAIIEDKILCVHGGISPDLEDLEQINKIVRPTKIPDKGLLCDLMWSDPDKDMKGWADNERGVSYVFGEDIITPFMKKHNLDLICRSHQLTAEGYEFFANRQLVTVYSVPDYCGEIDILAALMCVDENLMCSFQNLKPVDEKKKEM